MAELKRRNLSTPVIIDDVSTSWRFLTQRPDNSVLFDPLFIHQAKQSGYGAEISLPTPGFPGRRWLIQPDGTWRLPSKTIVDIALEQAEIRSKSSIS